MIKIEGRTIVMTVIINLIEETNTIQAEDITIIAGPLPPQRVTITVKGDLTIIMKGNPIDPAHLEDMIRDVTREGDRAQGKITRNIEGTHLRNPNMHRIIHKKTLLRPCHIRDLKILTKVLL
jgi:hypothetical protein